MWETDQDFLVSPAYAAFPDPETNRYRDDRLPDRTS